ncbi:ADP-ribose pyrophosphatase YjhB (NUDIX family) [Haloactinopolyspora alba]|uniref:ADP-ribose pyrophosphatase YjhB (NUDIX family) n=1 Tax=Haloactinopolyspora alba TaxID=648780 RepID=A0A2P8E152_9ACTN|nr:NUDIX domain-containing protein [Haloactinopolyspora alba]PSL03185.1 ADP-ribose pyrophosphatase YjhB (NUDIX family) [Haloactinopolyspora alba]
MPTPDFVRELRKHVGHDLLWLSGVTAVIFDDDGRVLLHQRSDTGTWSLISGILEPGEQPAQAAAREAYEETGVHVVVERVASVGAGEPMTYPNGDVVQYLDITFRCRAAGGTARVNDDESLAVDWFPPDALPPLRPDQHGRLRSAADRDAATRFTPPAVHTHRGSRS